MIIILIAGASASGKTRLAAELLARLNESGHGTHLLLKMDDYYHERPEGVDSEAFRRDTNFDTPTMLELSLLLEHLVCLDRGESITKPVFDFKTNRRVQTETINPPDVLIIEGLFALYFAQRLPRHLNTITAFVETDSYLELLKRRIKRDIDERGRRDADDVLQQERRFVGPAFFGTIAPSKSQADIVVDNSAQFIASAASAPHPLTTAVEVMIEIIGTKQAELAAAATRLV